MPSSDVSGSSCSLTSSLPSASDNERELAVGLEHADDFLADEADLRPRRQMECDHRVWSSQASRICMHAVGSCCSQESTWRPIVAIALVERGDAALAQQLARRGPQHQRLALAGRRDEQQFVVAEQVVAQSHVLARPDGLAGQRIDAVQIVQALEVNAVVVDRPDAAQAAAVRSSGTERVPPQGRVHRARDRWPGSSASRRSDR